MVVKPNSKKERTANATEKQLKLMKLQAKTLRREQERQATAAQDTKRQAEIEAGAWWLERDAFKGYGALTLKARYLGGWRTKPNLAVTESRNLTFDMLGLHLKGAVRTVLTVPWEEVQTLEVEDIVKAASRPAVEAVLSSEPGGNADERGVLVANCRSGEQVVFLMDRATAAFLNVRLLALFARLTQGRARASAIRQVDRSAAAVMLSANPIAVPSVADEIGKLGTLRASGLLSDEEFAALKAKLLA